jgi:hypothetical protein
LELRTLLAADASPWQNPVQPLDVNADGQVAPLDALIIINDLNAFGPRALVPAADQAAQPVGAPGDLIDVDGDQFVSPLDALIVINGLQQGAQALVRVRLEVTDTSGAPITTIEVGQNFQLRAFLQDLRGEAQGVFASYFDVTYSAALASVVGDLNFSADYPSGRLGDTTVDGLINEVGAFAGLTELGPSERLLFALEMQAQAAGVLNLTPDPADVLPAHDTLLFGRNTPVPIDEITFVGTTLTITGETELPTLTVADTSVVEGDSGTASMLFTVTLSAASTEAVTVDFATGDGTATAVSDYEPTSGTLTFAPGETKKTIEVLVQGDTLDEPDETLTLTLSNAVGATIARAAAVGTILDDDQAPTVSISIADAQAEEGHAGTTLMPFVVTLSAASGQTVTVDFATVSGTAQADSDFTAASGTVTFAPGETEQVINVTILGDTVFEPDESFEVHLANAVNATIADGVATGIILNDDEAPSGAVRMRLQITDLSGGDLTTIEVWQQFQLRALVEDLRSEPEGVFAAFLDATYNTALAGVSGPIVYGGDYPNGQQGDTATPGLIDEAGAFAGITPLGGGERLMWSVVFTANAQGEAVFTPEAADVLPDHDTLLFGQGTPVPIDEIVFLGDSLTITGGPGLPTVSIDDVSLPEGDEGTTEFVFTVTLSAPAEEEVMVHYRTEDGTATAGSDYEPTSGMLIFQPGQTTLPISVLVIGDTVFEANETFRVVLSDAVGANLGDALGIGTIENDDEGTFLPGALRGGVYADVNNNGQWDQRERGLPGVTIRLVGTNILDEPVNRQTVTDADGRYEFTNLVPGDYRLLQTQPAFYLDGKDVLHGPSSPGIAGNDEFTDIALGSGEEFDGYDFGERGLRPEFITRRLYLASTPAGELLNSASLARSGTWYALDDGWEGNLTASVAGGDHVGLELYDDQLRPLASSAGRGAASLSYQGLTGRAYFVQVTGAGELDVRFSNEAALAAAMASAADAALADEADWA